MAKALLLLVTVQACTARLHAVQRATRHAPKPSRGVAAPIRGGGENVKGVTGVTAFTHSVLGASVETGLLLGVIKAGRALPPAFSDFLVRMKVLPSATIRGLTAAEWLSYFVVVFGSSALSGVVSSSVRAASQQVLMPTKVAGETAWYAGLDRPSWEPPGIVFPIMWLLVSKPTQLLAITKLAASVGDAEFPWVPQLAVYCGHLALGDAWNSIFFGQQQIATGAIVISIFYATLLTASYLFYQSDQTAGLLMIPTCLWVTVASALNWSIYFRNKK